MTLKQSLKVALASYCCMYYKFSNFPNVDIYALQFYTRSPSKLIIIKILVWSLMTPTSQQNKYIYTTFPMIQKILQNKHLMTYLIFINYQSLTHFQYTHKKKSCVEKVSNLPINDYNLKKTLTKASLNSQKIRHQ